MIDPVVYVLIGALLLLLLIRVPIGFSLLIVGFAGLWYLKSINAAYQMLMSVSYNTVSNYVLLCVPLFIIMGFFAVSARLPDKAYESGYKIVGSLPGGLAMASSLGCGAFAAATGSSAATAATIGKVAVPEMRKRGYDAGFACAAVAGGGTMGILIPPSIIMVVYGQITDQSVGKLLIAGLIPGLITIVAYMVVAYISARLNPKIAPPGPTTTLLEKVKSLKGLWGFGILIGIVLGTIYTGFATPTEAAALGALAAFAMAIPTFIKHPREVSAALLDTAITSSMILVIMIGASLFTYFLTIANVPNTLTETVVNLNLPPTAVLALLLLLYIPLGMFLDAMSMMLITVPLALPILVGFGYDPIWFAVPLVIMMEIGYLTPPVGINAFVLHGINPDVPVEKIFVQALRFIAGNLAVLTLICIFPSIVLFLPNLMK